MTITIDRLLDDPALYFHSYDNDHGRFVAMDRDHYRRSIFLDRRIVRPDDQILRVPLDAVIPAVQARGSARPRLNFIHHVAQCGSTLLARALDRPGRALSLREPAHLRELGLMAGTRTDHGGARHQIWRELLDFSLAMLGKRFAGEGTVVVKGNVPITMIAPALDALDPGQAHVLLHYGLDDYLAAVLRTPNHGQWVEQVAAELRLGDEPAVGPLEALSTPQKAGALWLVMMRRFASLQAVNDRAMALDANRLFDSPAETIAAAARLFGITLEAGEADAIAASDLFTTYGKNPDQPYDPAQRLARRAATRSELADALAEARAWTAPRAREIGLPDALANPLVGAAASLL